MFYEIFSKQFLKLNRTISKSHLNLILLLLMYQRLKLLLLQSLTKSTRERAKSLSFFSYFSSSLEIRYHLFYELFFFKAMITYIASKLVTICPSSAVISGPAIIIFKTIKLQIALSSVLLAFKSKLKIKFFAQTTKTNITQQTSRFTSVLSHENFLCLLQLKEKFCNLFKLQLFLYTRPAKVV